MIIAVTEKPTVQRRSVPSMGSGHTCALILTNDLGFAQRRIYFPEQRDGKLKGSEAQSKSEVNIIAMRHRVYFEGDESDIINAWNKAKKFIDLFNRMTDVTYTNHDSLRAMNCRAGIVMTLTTLGKNWEPVPGVSATRGTMPEPTSQYCS